MNVVPVANYRERQQHEGNHEQSDGFRRVGGVALVTSVGILLGGVYIHGAILALALTMEKVLA